MRNNNRSRYGTIQHSGEREATPVTSTGHWKPLESSHHPQLSQQSIRSSSGQSIRSSRSIRNSFYSHSNALCFRQFRWCIACYEAKFVTIEPVMFIIMFAMYLHKIVFELYTFTSFARQKISGTNSSNNSMCIGTNFLNNITSMKEVCDVGITWTNKTGDRVEIETGLLNMVVNITSGLCSIFGMLMLGPISNIIGRKGALCIILAGMLLQTVLTVAIVNNPHKIDLHFFVLGAGIRGLTGGVAGIYTVSYSYITELSTYSGKKTFFVWRIGIIEALSFVAVSLGLATGGLMIDFLHCDFVIPAYIIVCGVIFAFVYTLIATAEFRNHLYADTSNNSPLPQKIPKVITGPKYLIRGVKLFFSKKDFRLKLWVILLVLVITVINSTGITAIMTLFLLHEPLHWRPAMIGAYFGMSEFIHGLILVVILPMLLSAGIHDGTIVCLSTLMTIAMNTVFAFVDVTWKVFVVGIVQSLEFLIVPTLKAMMSKIITEPEERGGLFSFISIVQVLSTIVGYCIYIPLYIFFLSEGWSPGNYSGTSFLVMAAVYTLTIPLICFLAVIKVLEKRRQKRDYFSIHGNSPTSTPPISGSAKPTKPQSRSSFEASIGQEVADKESSTQSQQKQRREWMEHSYTSLSDYHTNRQ